MSSTDTPKYWFPAKRYGWGWGLPCSWQGWIVFIAYFALIIGGIPWIKIPKGDFAYIAYALALTIILIVICWITGEPPRWRWGARDV